MNNLSWLIYLGDLSRSLSTVFGIFGGILIIGWLAATLFRLLEIWDAYSQETRERAQGIPRPPKYVIAIGMAMIFVAIMLPARSTVYMIAASQIGQTVAQSADGSMILGLLKKKVVKYLQDDSHE